MRIEGPPKKIEDMSQEEASNLLAQIADKYAGKKGRIVFARDNDGNITGAHRHRGIWARIRYATATLRRTETDFGKLFAKATGQDINNAQVVPNLRAGHLGPQGNPRGVVGQLTPGLLQSAARQRIESVLVQIYLSPKTVTIVPGLGICELALGDWRRDGISVGNRYFLPRPDDMDTLTELVNALDEVAGNDHTLKFKASQLANQVLFDPIHLAQSDWNMLLTDDGKPARFSRLRGEPNALLEHVHRYGFSRSNNGGIDIEASVLRRWSNDGANGEKRVDPARNFFKADFALNLGPAPDYVVTMARPLRIDARHDDYSPDE